MRRGAGRTGNPAAAAPAGQGWSRLVDGFGARPVNLLGYIGSFPMRFDFHEYVRGQLSGELEDLLHGEKLGAVEKLQVFLGYITVFRIVKPHEGLRPIA